MDWGSIPHDSNYMGMSMWWDTLEMVNEALSKVSFEILCLIRIGNDVSMG